MVPHADGGSLSAAQLKRQSDPWLLSLARRSPPSPPQAWRSSPFPSFLGVPALVPPMPNRGRGAGGMGDMAKPAEAATRPPLTAVPAHPAHLPPAPRPPAMAGPAP